MLPAVQYPRGTPRDTQGGYWGQPPRGKLAWGRLKETAHDQRNWWLEVGAALAAGKNQHNRPVIKTDARGRHYFQKFSDWVKENFPGLERGHDIADAM